MPIFFIAFPFGIVIALQALAIVRQYGVTAQVSGVLSHLMVRELSPITTGMMIAAQSGGSIAAEIASFKVKKQINSLESMGIDPYNYIIFPRFLAIIIVTPIMEIFSVTFSIIGGYLTAVYLGGISSGAFIHNLNEFTTTNDIFFGLIKSLLFGIIIATVGSFHGINSKYSSKDVGLAANNTVVEATIFFIFINYIISSFAY